VHAGGAPPHPTLAGLALAQGMDLLALDPGAALDQQLELAFAVDHLAFAEQQPLQCIEHPERQHLADLEQVAHLLNGYPLLVRLHGRECRSARRPAGRGIMRRMTDPDLQADTAALIQSRHHVAPRRLVEPGPDALQLESLLELAAAAPDHGQIRPWRFVLVEPGERARLGEAFALALRDRHPAASEDQLAAAREKALRAPVLLVAVVALGPRDPDIPGAERLVSLGAAIQNLLLGAHAMGFGSGLTSGQAMSSPRLHALCGLQPDEQAVCCVNLGTATRARSAARPRPTASQILSRLPPA
jgi:nitroreductase